MTDFLNIFDGKYENGELKEIANLTGVFPPIHKKGLAAFMASKHLKLSLYQTVSLDQRNCQFSNCVPCVTKSNRTEEINTFVADGVYET